MWVDELQRRVMKLPKDSALVVDDTRFPNEFWRLRTAMKFVPTCVVCSSETRVRRLNQRGDRFLPLQDEHESEELPAKVSDLAINTNMMPVIWNDENCQKPDREWIFTLDEWLNAVEGLQLDCDDKILRDNIRGWKSHEYDAY
ncbi:hypothetical protein HFO13_12790 [Rhizobium leguminosarum]|nr:hypothetical protein [Rhizobium leguminosarum]